MIAALRPYPAYKDSGVPWLGQVPEHWEVRRGKALFRCIDVRSQTGEEELLTVSSERGVVPRRSANVTMFQAESYTGYKLCWPDDLVINSLWAWARGLGVSPYHGIVSSAYGVYRLRNSQQNNPSFIHQLVRSIPFQWELHVRSKGIWVSRLQLTDDAFLSAPLPMPPSEEQTAIVRFLDYMDRRIRRYTRAKQKLIKLLEEYRQALIHQAVTGKIDVRTGKPYPAYKDSGVPWLGQVPAHWEVLPGHGCFVERKQPNIGLMETTVLSLSYWRIVVKPVEKLRGLVPASFETYQIVDPGDIVCRPTDLQNDQESLRFGMVRNRGIITSAYISFRTTGRLDSNYGYLLLHAYDVRKIFYGLGSGLRQNLDWRDFKRLPCLVPPLPEQTAIVAFLDAQTAKLDAAIAAARREIELLHEYRERLIADVVTGKVDVREVAAQLPEEPPDQEAELLEEEAATGEADGKEAKEETDDEE